MAEELPFDAIVAPRGVSPLDGTDPIFQLWVSDSITQLPLLLWHKNIRAIGIPGSRALQKIPSVL